MQTTIKGRNAKYTPFNQKDSIYMPYKGHIVFVWGDRFYRFPCDRKRGNKPKYKIKGKDGKEWVRYSLEDLTEFINHKGVASFQYEVVEFKIELVHTSIVVTQEFKDDFIVARAKSCTNTSLSYKIYPRDLVRKYPLLMEFERTRFSTKKCLVKSLQYYLALSLEGGR